MSNNGSSKSYISIILTAAISGLLSATLMFVGVWFTAVQGQGDVYLADRQFILNSLQRHDGTLVSLQASTNAYSGDRQFISDSLFRHQQSIDILQTNRYEQGTRLAEIRTELVSIRAVLERMESQRGLD